MVRTGDDVGDEFGLRGVGNRWLEHSDDVGLTGAEPDGFVQDGRIALQDGGPEAIGQYGSAGGGRTVVAHIEETAENGTQSHEFDVGAAFHAAANLPRLAEADQSESDGGEVAERGDGFDAIAKVMEFGHG